MELAQTNANRSRLLFSKTEQRGKRRGRRSAGATPSPRDRLEVQVRFTEGWEPSPALEGTSSGAVPVAVCPARGRLSCSRTASPRLWAGVLRERRHAKPKHEAQSSNDVPALGMSSRLPVQTLSLSPPTLRRARPPNSVARPTVSPWQGF